MKSIITSFTILISLVAQTQTTPSFGPETDVSILGLTFDAMEPFVSPDGNILFFNNLNDGVNTKLYYASKVTDSTFNYIGELNGANQIAPPHLDAVPDMDSSLNFYWTSTRNYPFELNNLFHGKFDAGNITSIGRVNGNFNKNTLGWLVMDHGISYDGELLYYNNARFDSINCQGACETEIGIAQKINDSTFNKIANSNTILQTVNDPNFIYYAPCISSDNLELYYTRYQKDTITLATLFEICVAVRGTSSSAFSTPTVLFSEFISDLIEAPTLTTDKQIIYYHRKTIGSHKIVMRRRNTFLSAETLSEKKSNVKIYPNPTSGILKIKSDIKYKTLKLSLLTLLGTEMFSVENQTEIDINSIPSGTYLIKIEIDNNIITDKILKLD